MAHSENRQRTEQVNVRFLPDERQALTEAAHKRGVSVGELLRTALRHELLELNQEASA